MLIRSFKRRLERAPLLGAWSSLGHPAVASLLARSGADWLVLDAEHGMFSAELIRACLDAAQPLGVPTLVRVPANDPDVIKVILDLGPDGIVVPMVNSAAQAAAAVDACLYPPDGHRGFGAGRAAGYGIDYVEYRTTANAELAVIVQVEHVDGLAAVDEIARTPGVTGLFVGPTDLSASMNLLGQEGHPRVEAAIDTVIRAGAAAGVPVGTFSGSEEQALDRIARGAQFVAWNNDLGLLATAARETVMRVRDRL